MSGALARRLADRMHCPLTEAQKMADVMMAWLAEPQQIETMTRARWNFTARHLTDTNWRRYDEERDGFRKALRGGTRAAIAALAAEPGEVTDG
jgi:hypothetical protein